MTYRSIAKPLDDLYQTRSSSRRSWLVHTSKLAAAIGVLPSSSLFAYPLDSIARSKKKVAAVVTVYRKMSHADVLVGKILEGIISCWNIVSC